MARSRSRVISTRARIKLRRIVQHTETDLGPTMREAAALLLADMQANVPRVSGALADALTAFVSRNGLRLEVGLRGKKKLREFFYARFIEYGTKGHRIDPAVKGAIAFDGEGPYGAVEHPGITPQPFMQPAYDTNKTEILRMIDKMIAQALEKAQR